MLAQILLLLLYKLTTTIMTLSSADLPKQQYTFSVDHNNMYGDLVVAEFVDEEVDKKYCDGFAILVPAVDVRDVPSLKARIIDANTVEVVTVAYRHGFRNHSNSWMKVLESIQKKAHAAKLVKTLRSMFTRMNKTKKKYLKKILISFPGVQISNEYFSPGAPDGALTMLPLPYVFEHETTSKKSNTTAKFKSTEATILWRVFVVDSDRDIEEDAVEDDDVMDQLGDMIGTL